MASTPKARENGYVQCQSLVWFNMTKKPFGAHPLMLFCEHLTYSSSYINNLAYPFYLAIRQRLE